MAEKRELLIAFKHRRCKTFKVGRFKFEDHILKLYDEADKAEFIRLYDGLIGMDKQSIVEVLQLENERPINRGRRIDGAASTSKMVDSKDTKAPDVTEVEPAATPATPAEPAEPADTPASPRPGLNLLNPSRTT